MPVLRPGRKLKERLTRNVPGINELDRARKAHDIAHPITNDQKKRNYADNILAKAAWQHVEASVSGVAERLNALGAAGHMKAKARAVKDFGMVSAKKMWGKKATKKKPTDRQILQRAVKTAREIVKLDKPKRSPDAAKLAVNVAKLAVKGHKLNKKTIESGLPCIIPTPKVGGILPMVTKSAGLSALGAPMGGSAGAANAALPAQRPKKDLIETQRHNQTMESIALGGNIRRGQNSMMARVGSDLQLNSCKNGLGLYLKPLNNSNNETRNE